MEQADEDSRWLRREALANARHRAGLVGFRPAKLTGVHPSELRAKALRPSLAPTPGELLLLAAIGAGAFFFGRWWGRKQKPAKTAGGPRVAGHSSTGLVGIDIFAIRGEDVAGDDDNLNLLGAR